MVDKLIEQHGRRLYGLCRTLCANPVDADDLYQETWLKVIRKMDLYNSSYEFEGWLTRICVNIYRDNWRRKRIGLFFDGFATQEIKDAVMENVAATDKPDDHEPQDAVNQLPEKLRITVLLYYFRDMDINQTAHALGIPPGTVKSRLNTAKKMLKEMLKNEIEL